MRLTLPDGVGLNIEVAGSGQPMVLLHGFTGSAASWGEHIDRFASWFTVVAVDLLGHGESDSPADPQRYQMNRCLEDLHFVLEHLDLGPIHLLGYSMGGRAALSFALAHPERVQTLTLESASPGLAGTEERSDRVKTDEALAARIETDGIEAFVDEWERLPLFASQARLPKPVRTRLRAGRLRNNPIGLANSLRGMGTGVQAENWSRLSELRMPVMFVAGYLDSKYTNIARQMAGAIPGAALAIVQRAGHTVHLERPAVFRRGVLMFLERNSE